MLTVASAAWCGRWCSSCSTGILLAHWKAVKALAWFAIFERMLNVGAFAMIVKIISDVPDKMEGQNARQGLSSLLDTWSTEVCQTCPACPEYFAITAFVDSCWGKDWQQGKMVLRHDNLYQSYWLPTWSVHAPGISCLLTSQTWTLTYDLQGQPRPYGPSPYQLSWPKFRPWAHVGQPKYNFGFLIEYRPRTLMYRGNIKGS